mmetsp:Transcript_23357/g.69054  ORF Transcript_23357/g.69054 Transcript_23357/m.69054 type:complete len:285 (-) Transcript_23357:1360-2214(-)
MGDAAANQMYLREGSFSSSSASASEERAGDGLGGAAVASVFSSCVVAAAAEAAAEAVFVHQGAFPALTFFPPEGGAAVSPSSSVALAGTLRSRRAVALRAAAALSAPSFLRPSATSGSSCHVSNQAMHPLAAASYPPSASALANATASTLQLSAATSHPAPSASASTMSSTLSPPARTMPLSRERDSWDGSAGTTHGLMTRPAPVAVLPADDDASLPTSSASWSIVLRLWRASGRGLVVVSPSFAPHPPAAAAALSPNDLAAPPNASAAVRPPSAMPSQRPAAS